jgi:AAA+ ATPase superfamily predicted ATPase
MSEASTLIDRQVERDGLRALLDRGEPALALLYGRRRVGKTHLLNNVWPREQVFYFTAAETTEEQNRATLVQDLADWSGQELHAGDYPSWRTVFRLLLEARTPGPLVIVLDEFQYLGKEVDDLSSIASELNAVWEQRRPKRPLVLVLSGSAVKSLEALHAGGAPLYGRFAWVAKIDPFDYGHAAEMVPVRALRDRVRLYAAFGGTPRYLAAVDPSASVDDNIAKLLLDPRGEVRMLVETALIQERGLREVPKYQAILRAIGTGSTELQEIKDKAGLRDDADTQVRRMVDKLIDLGYVRAERNIGAHSTAPYRFRIDDPAFAFYYEFVTRFEAALVRNDPLKVWDRHIAPVFDSYVGHVFERVAEQAYQRAADRLGLPMVDEWGRWEGADKERKSLEVDIVAPLTDGRVMTGGVKWNGAPLEAKWHVHHMEMLRRLTQSGVKWAHAAADPKAPLIWVAAGGFTPAFVKAVRAEREEVYLWDLSTLYPRTRSASSRRASAKHGTAGA